jgi:hypothetical protein
VADAAKADQREKQRKLDAARANVKDAEAALDTDKMLVKGECKTGVGKECKALARGGKETLQTAIELRTKLANAEEPPEDKTAERLSALTGGYLSKEQIETFQPMLVPVAVSFLAGLLITLALEVEMPGHKPAPKPERTGWRWLAWGRKAAVPSPVVAPTVIDSEPQPVQKPTPPRVPERPRPRLAAATRQPIGAVLDFLHDAVEIVDDAPKIEMSDAYIGYAAWCRTKSLRPMEAGEFFNDMADHCAEFGIPIWEEAGCVYLGNVRLAPEPETEAAIDRRATPAA